MNPETELGRRLLEAPLPGDGAARERVRRTVLAAHGGTPRRARTRVRRAAAAVAVAVLAAGVLTQPGQAVAKWLRSPVERFVERVRPAPQAPPPALRMVDGLALPTAGQLLVTGDRGLWVVQRDGTRRRLGDWKEATWSPGGLFVGVAAGRELAAVDPHGKLRWRLRLPAAVSFPRWGPDRLHVAYRSGSTLRVVWGNGLNDAAIATGTAAVAPAWRPADFHTLAWAAADGTVTVADTDTGRVIWTHSGGPVRRLAWSADGRRLLIAGRRHGAVYNLGGGAPQQLGLDAGEELVAAEFAPRGTALALAVRDAGSGQTELRLLGGDAPLVEAPSVRELRWSPDGRWLLAGRPEDDQWLLVNATSRQPVQAVTGVTRRFGAGTRTQGWCCGGK